MYLKVLINLAILLQVLVSGDEEMKCTKDFCEDYQEKHGCPVLSSECSIVNSTYNGIFLRYPDTCNCCDYCLSYLKENQECEFGLPGMPAPHKICGPTLACTRNENDSPTCQRINSACFTARASYDKRKVTGIVGMAEVRPKCDEDGFFTPNHCIPGSICYCVAPNGKRIFGETPFRNKEDEEKMTCGCSIVAWKARNTLQKEYGTSTIRCTESGLFDPLQCTSGPNAYCFCVDQVTGLLLKNVDSVPESQLRKNNPPCFDSKRHTEKSYSTLCDKLHGNFLPEHRNVEDFCQPDGNFVRIQIFGSKKMCVDPKGKRIEKYEAVKDSKEGTIMDCNCARTRWTLAKFGIQELPRCCPFGNFEAWQCHRGECYCVDKDGNQISSQVLVSNISNLQCHKESNGDPCFVPK